MSSAEWDPLVEVPSHLTGPIGLLSVTLRGLFGSQRGLYESGT